MSHELRTPLNAVLGFAQLNMLDKTLSPQQTANNKQIYDSGTYLLSLVNDLLDLSSIEAGKIKLNLEPVNLNQLLYECYHIIAPLAKEESVQVWYEKQENTSRIVQADYVRLKQVLLNLLTNAIKYHGTDKPQVWLSYLFKDDILEISVKDNGSGIEHDKQLDLFESFNRIGAENTYVDGFGIGLYVSMKLIQTMQGTINVKSAPGKGSTFTVCLHL